MPTPTHRALVIEDHFCSNCGNKWTSSYAVLTDNSFSIWGGKPVGPETTLPFISFAPRQSLPQNGCFRCIHSLLPSTPVLDRAQPETEKDLLCL